MAKCKYAGSKKYFNIIRKIITYSFTMVSLSITAFDLNAIFAI